MYSKDIKASSNGSEDWEAKTCKIIMNNLNVMCAGLAGKMYQQQLSFKLYESIFQAGFKIWNECKAWIKMNMRRDF